jgi:histidinol-phosphatase
LKSFQKETEYALKVVKASERITLKYFNSRFKVDYKSDKSPVTIADKSCEKFLVKELSKKFPDHGFYGEEFGGSGMEFPHKGQSTFRWIIDPIDGTRNFTRGIPYWGTLCGLEHEGQIVAGIMALPALKEIYYASKGQGAYKNGKRIKVSKIKELEKSTIVFGGLNFFLGTKYEKGFGEIIKTAYHDRGFGDCFGYTFVANGSAEAMLDPIVSPWDVAAVKIIIEEAGGIFTDFEGDPTIYSKTGVAANPYVHEAVLRRLSQL